MGKIGRRAVFPAALFAIVGLGGCGNYFYHPRPAGPVIATPNPADKTRSSLEALCDVYRIRAKETLVKRFSIGLFRDVALRISKEFTSDELADLSKLEAARSAGDAGWEIARRRGELIAQIYRDAVERAGLKTDSTEVVSGTALTYAVVLDPSSAGSDPYAPLVLGHLSPDPGQEGAISQVVLAARPDQRRYYVSLNRFLRFDAQTDGTKTPVYEALSLSDAIEEIVPRYCSGVESSDPSSDTLNTVEGLPQ